MRAIDYKLIFKTKTAEDVTSALADGANIFATDAMGATALHQAASMGNGPVLRKLLEHINNRADVSKVFKYNFINRLSHGGMTALHEACISPLGDDTAKIALLLINNGANPNLKDSRFQSSLDYINSGPLRDSLIIAASAYEDKLAESLLESKTEAEFREILSIDRTDPNRKLAAPSTWATSPYLEHILSKAALSGNTDVITWLITIANVDPNIQVLDHHCHTALDLVGEHFLDGNPDLKTPNKTIRTLMALGATSSAFLLDKLAGASQFHDVMEDVITNGLENNTINLNDLGEAFGLVQSEYDIQLLLKYGACINHLNSSYNPPLETIFSFQEGDNAQLLLLYGASPHVRKQDGSIARVQLDRLEGLEEYYQDTLHILYNHNLSHLLALFNTTINIEGQDKLLVKPEFAGFADGNPVPKLVCEKLAKHITLAGTTLNFFHYDERQTNLDKVNFRVAVIKSGLRRINDDQRDNTDFPFSSANSLG